MSRSILPHLVRSTFSAKDAKGSVIFVCQFSPEECFDPTKSIDKNFSLQIFIPFKIKYAVIDMSELYGRAY
jgi:hypothetical protein